MRGYSPVVARPNGCEGITVFDIERARVPRWSWHALTALCGQERDKRCLEHSRWSQFQWLDLYTSMSSP